ncbi:hypothetical protein [Rothia terrae]|uniref:Uncharacterized protein n=1 Tax=Rothia terrae TaxID=396015 RepID=A0A7H2BDQ3_9MICC|nr:hypothetical protein [Rothia terrae]QNV37799.1 hypothetical protein IDM49_00325 [Rothia terrae]
MDFKELSPAFLTSLVAIFVGAIMIGASSTFITVLGWILLLAGLALNVFSAVVSIQQAKGAPLPFLREDREPKALSQSEEVSFDEDPEPDTESQPIVSIAEDADEQDNSIFKSRQKKSASVRA